MAGDVFERLLASVPVDASAGRQQSRGVHWQPLVAIHDYYAERPELKAAVEIRQIAALNPEFFDFTGQSYGRLTVLGLRKKQASGKASWVCRCACGGYCTRPSRSLRVAMRGGNSFVGHCGMCDRQMWIRRQGSSQVAALRGGSK